MDPDRLVRIGLIGAGWIGCHHGRNVAANPYAELAAVSDTAIDKAKAFGDAEGVPARIYADYRDMLAQDDIDAVIVASPNALHAEHATAAAEAGKHIYLEKPMAITLEDCRQVARAAEKAGVKCAMGYHRRFNPLVEHAKALQSEGQLGDLVLAESDYIHYVPGDWDIWDWLGKEEIAGSLIHAGAGHNIDLLRHFCGEVVEVSCFKDIRMPRKRQVETEDVAVINLRFESGALGRVVLFVGPILPFRFTLRLFGTRGTVDQNRVWLDSTPSFDQPGSSIELPQAWIPDNVQGGISETWGKCMDSFIDDIRLDRAPSNDATSGFNTAAVCFAALRSAADRAIALPETL